MRETGACYMLENFNGMEELKVASDNFGGRGQGWFTLHPFKTDEVNGKLRLTLWGITKNMLENVWLFSQILYGLPFSVRGRVATP